MRLETSIQSMLESHGQEHLIQFWDELSESQCESLVEQIAQVDLELIKSLIIGEKESESWAELAKRAESPPAIALGQTEPFTPEQARQCGEQALSDGKVGMLLVAGGQGSRLGFPHPKGMYPIGPISNRTLYQVFVDLVLAKAARYGKSIPLYVMTSPPTHDATTTFLNEHEFFGLSNSEISIFCQGAMPAVDAGTGSVLMSDKSSLFMSPDGHGGTLAAFQKSGCLKDVQQRGIQYLFYGQIDNPLIQLCDPLTIGYHILSRSQMTSQAVRKSEPSQRVGSFASIDGRVRIIEYSDLPDEQAAETADDGTLKFWAGSIAVHVFDVSFMAQAVEKADSLPFHLARKKVAFIDKSGKLIEPDEANAIKFERFIFDLLPMAENAIVVEIDPRDGFAAVKNGVDATSETATTAKAAMIDQHRRWLQAAGVDVLDGTAVEINPQFALDADELKLKKEIPPVVEQPTYFE